MGIVVIKKAEYSNAAGRQVAGPTNQVFDSGYKPKELPYAITDQALVDAGWEVIGQEGETVKVEPNTLVKYGANGSYVDKTISGSFVVGVAEFGSDPIVGTVKSAYKQKVAANTNTDEAPKEETLFTTTNVLIGLGVIGLAVFAIMKFGKSK